MWYKIMKKQKSEKVGVKKQDFKKAYEKKILRMSIEYAWK